MSENVIIDTDPGQDDAVAILLALASPKEINLLGLTAVAGNVPLNLTLKNARTICELAKMKNISIFKGCEKPLKRNLVTAEHVHGKTGLDGIILPEPTMPIKESHAVDFIIETIRENPRHAITICALGPLTNIAMALEKAQDIAIKIKQIILMGGAYFEVGNITPTAEFNIYVDPEAAKIVFNSGVKLIILPLDVTHKALISEDRVNAFKKIGTPVAKAVSEWTNFFERFDKEKYGSVGAPLHDPCVIAYLLDPSIFTGRYINVEIETESDLTRGMTVADWWRVTDRKPNALFIGNLDPDRFFKLLTERLSTL